jgi:hypothetical protein
LAIDSCNQEEQHRCVDPISPDAKGLGRVVVGTMPPYKDPHHQHDDDDNNDNNRLTRYLALIALLSTLLCIGTCCHFCESPPNPPNALEMGKATHDHRHHHAAVPFHRLARGFLRRGGFGMPLAAFVFSIAVTNIVGAFIEEVSEMREAFPLFFVFPPPPGPCVPLLFCWGIHWWAVRVD